MKTSFIGFETSIAVVAAAALTSGATSAQMFNAYQFDQMKAPATKTRAAVRAEVASAVSDRRRRGGAQPAPQDQKAASRSAGQAPLRQATDGGGLF